MINSLSWLLLIIIYKAKNWVEITFSTYPKSTLRKYPSVYSKLSSYAYICIHLFKWIFQMFNIRWHAEWDYIYIVQFPRSVWSKFRINMASTHPPMVNSFEWNGRSLAHLHWFGSREDWEKRLFILA